jgi:hypothetical protein
MFDFCVIDVMILKNLNNAKLDQTPDKSEELAIVSSINNKNKKKHSAPRRA